MFTKLVAKLVSNKNNEWFQKSVSVFKKCGLLISARNTWNHYS